jgi:hypothetical protein
MPIEAVGTRTLCLRRVVPMAKKVFMNALTFEAADDESAQQESLLFWQVFKRSPFTAAKQSVVYQYGLFGPLSATWAFNQLMK